MEKASRFPRWLTAIGAVLLLPAALLCWSMIWQQTELSWQRGPQMVGFSLGHSMVGALLLLGAMLMLAWLLVAALVMLVKRSLGGKAFAAVFLAGVLALALLAVPYEGWQYLFAGQVAKSRHGGEFAASAAGQGQAWLLAAFLDNGLPVDARMEDGRTALHFAATANQTETIAYLLSKGADVNALSRAGDSPLGVARERHHEAAASLLQSRGGKEVRGTAEQRDAVSKDIVGRQSREMAGQMLKCTPEEIASEAAFRKCLERARDTDPMRSGDRPR